MVAALVDTNGLASGFVREESVPGEILRRWKQDEFELVTSEEIIEELMHTFQDPYFSARLTPERQANNIELLRRQARIVSPAVEISGVATHPEDDVILSVAVSAQVDFLVTGDRQLLRLGSYQGVVILTPRDFLATLGGL